MLEPIISNVEICVGYNPFPHKSQIVFKYLETAVKATKENCFYRQLTVLTVSFMAAEDFAYNLSL